MSDKKAAQTNKVQFKRLVQLMEQRLDLANKFPRHGVDKREVDEFWSMVANELNGFGPPRKDKTLWRKVWLDYKNYIKKKLVSNKLQLKTTGGGKNRAYMFTETEETVIRITGLETSTEGIRGASPIPSTSEEMVESVKQEIVENSLQGIAPNPLTEIESTNENERILVDNASRNERRDNRRNINFTIRPLLKQNVKEKKEKKKRRKKKIFWKTMSHKKAAQTNKVQFKRLVQLMEQRPDLATKFPRHGVDKREVDDFWSMVANELNAFGPPRKDKTLWRKVWLDYKNYIKKKLASNKLQLKTTGGGKNRTYVFTETEETVIRITGLETSTEGIRGTSPIPSTSEEMVESVMQEIVESSLQGIAPNPLTEIESTNENERILVDNASRTERRDNRRNKNFTIEPLLKQDVEEKKEFYKNIVNELNDITNNLKTVRKELGRIGDYKKAELNELQRHNEAVEKIMMEKNHIKLQNLEIEKEKLEIKRMKLNYLNNF